ncbi:hypothetical protein [Bifidobacterium sp.]|uniref:hypothetical protein n=1 Tax=Bifidobacterium sp. TaxID=41200 RepID=UPI0039E863EF
MMKRFAIDINDVRKDGYPPVDSGGIPLRINELHFLFDHRWVSGWPSHKSAFGGFDETDDEGFSLWEQDDDYGISKKYSGVRYWSYFPVFSIDAGKDLTSPTVDL